jgi:hypothetical protein
VTNCGTNLPQNTVLEVPEPGALALFLMGLAGMIGLAFRRRA